MMNLQEEKVEEKDDHEQEHRQLVQSFPRECCGTFMENKEGRIGKYVLGHSRTPYILGLLSLYWTRILGQAVLDF